MSKANVKIVNVSKSWAIEMHSDYKEMFKSYTLKHNSMSRVKVWCDPKWFYLKYHIEE